VDETPLIDEHDPTSDDRAPGDPPLVWKVGHIVLLALPMATLWKWSTALVPLAMGLHVLIVLAAIASTVRVYRYPGVPRLKAFARSMFVVQLVTLPIAFINLLSMICIMDGGSFVG
jgi:hypothetical protein